MRCILAGAAVLGFTVLASNGASAQSASAPSRPIQFGVMGGVSFPVGNSHDSFKTGWNAGALLNFALPALPIGIRVDGQWDQFNTKGVSGSHLRLVDGTADAVFNFPSASMMKFYLLGGVGIYNYKITGDNSDFDFSSGSQTKFGLNGGAGLKVTLAGGFSPFVEARYHYVFSGSDFNNDGNKAKLQMIPISVGVTF